jgi:hypothetical protein
MRAERWKSVPGFEGFYEASTLGRIRRMPEGRLLDWSRQTGRYRNVKLCRPGHKKMMCVHSVIALTFRGPTPPGQEIRHHDGDHLNCRLSNIRFGTPLQNHADKRRHGTILTGAAHQNTILNESQVQIIRTMKPGGVARYARLIGISLGHAYNIRYGSRRNQ